MKICVYFFDGTQIPKGKLDDTESYIISGLPKAQMRMFFDNSYTFISIKRLKIGQNAALLFGGHKSSILIPETAHEIFPIFSKMITFDHKKTLISAHYFQKT